MAAAGTVGLPLTPRWDLVGSDKAVGRNVQALSPRQRVDGWTDETVFDGSQPIGA